MMMIMIMIMIIIIIVITNQGLQSRTVKLVTSNKKMLERMTTFPHWGGALPYMGYIGMCSPKGYVFQLFWSYSTAWSHMHFSRGFHEVDARAVHEVCPHVHSGRINEARDETETKPRESCVLQ